MNAQRKTLHVLLVDDNPDDRAMIRGQLRANPRQKYLFEEFRNGREVLAWLRENPAPDCIILDVHMPEMTGNQVLKELATPKGTTLAPIIVLTGSGENSEQDDADAAEALALGAQDYVTKDSVQPETLWRTVHNAMERFRLIRRLNDQEEQYRLAIDAAQLGAWRFAPDTGHFHCSGRCREVMGLPAADEPLDIDGFLQGVHAEDRDALRKEIQHDLPRRIGRIVRVEYRVPTQHGADRWVTLRGRIDTDEYGKPTLTGTILDVTDRKQFEGERQEELEVLDALYRVGQSFATASEPADAIQLATDIATSLTHAQFGAFFYNIVDSQGESYMLYTLAGVEREAFSAFPMPRNTAVFAPTFSDEHTMRIDDITKDPRYGHNAPHYGMPAGHLPVVSYLAVPVVSKGGEVLGGLFFGHGEPGIFTERAERIAKAIATQAAVGIENARLVNILRSSEERWRNLAEAMPQLVWIDRASDGWCEYLSGQWQTYTGIETEKLLGFEWLKLLHPDDRERAAAAWQEAVHDRADYNIEYRIRRHDGEYRWFKTRGVPIRDESGNILIWYGTCTEIQELVESRERAEAANIAKSEFLANMSHEIRTPMNAVVGLANILALSQPLTPKQKEFIRTLQLSADALLELINDLLDIAKIEARTMEIERIPFSLARILQEVVSIMSVRAGEKGLAFTLDAAEIDGLTFLGDPTRLRQIIMNLCSNAIKFTDHGSVTVAVHAIDDASGGRQTCIAVTDTGIGIAPDKIEAIFHKFVQADNTINRKYGGTGLGLAITRTLAEMMGGSVAIASEPGKGSTFTVCIPMETAESSDAASADLSPAVPGHAPAARGPAVLLVEDHAPNVLVASTFLEQFGYHTEVAGNGLEALEMAKAGNYRVILMDVQMHGMNGFEATKLIREHEARSGSSPVPIIGMTAHALAGDRERCLSAGMDDYIAKPFDPAELQRKLAALIEPSGT